MEKQSQLTRTLIAKDKDHVWHPCTQMKDHEDFPIIPIERGEGVWLYDTEGNKYLDAVSSWWVNIFGHANPVISQAIADQANCLEQVLLAGFTHQPVVDLSTQLVELTPDNLQKCFYADNGSSAVEVALKMSFHYWRNVGKTDKKKFVALKNSYHGETIGALSVGDVELYKDTYQDLLLDVIIVEGADNYDKPAGESVDAYVERCFQAMEDTLAQRHNEISAVIVEPLVQCAGSMRMYDAAYLQRLRAACDRYDVHLIADEVAVGFGRTGHLFACQKAAISPDFMCLSKGLTGGYLPLSVVLTTQQIYAAFYDEYTSLRAFLHSHSYTGNPLACAAALATLKLFKDNDVINTNQKLIERIKHNGERFRGHQHIGDIRQTGMIFAIELVQDTASKKAYPWQQRRGLKAYHFALKNQLLLRPLGSVIYFMPPYVITTEQIDMVFDVMEQAVEIAVAD